MTTAFVNERNLIIAKEVQRIAKETNKTTIASSFRLDKASKRERGVIVPIVGGLEPKIKWRSILALLT